MNVTGKQVAEKALSYATSVKRNIFGTITKIEADPARYPYKNGAEGPAEFDCQGWLEAILRALGLKVSFAGTNDMWRNMGYEKGTIAECVKRYGKVPIGTPILIVDHNGEEPDKYQGDGEGNAWHVYIKVADGWLMHASQSNGGVSVKEFKDKAINGGPSHYLFPKGVTFEGVNVETAAEQVSTPVMSDVDTAIPARWKPQYSHLRFRQGDMGNGAREIQTALNKLGYGLSVDGDFGPLTDEAVRKFQGAHKLEVDGVVGEYTWEALIDAVNAA
ncbi:MAG TPA: peptidoglycan-binding domain-containing protein [Candidatus Limiplasma sp.]|nr:peptidoglycan-binding domain-containing protein [Candidatus Limiplasma sp.]